MSTSTSPTISPTALNVRYGTVTSQSPPGDLLPRFISPQQHNPVLPNAAIPPTASRVQLEGRWEDVVPPTVQVHGAVQGTPQDYQHFNIANRCLADYRELRDDPVVPYVYPNVGLAQDAPEHGQVLSPDHQANHGLGYAPRSIVPGPTQTAFPDPSTYQPHAVGQPAVENLRRLASRYVHHPDSKVDMVRMEPGTAGRYKVVIVLKMSDFF